MEPNQMQNVSVKSKSSPKDFFLNLGAIVALFTVIGNLINILFIVINTAFPQIVNTYYSYYTPSISFPVATLIIFFPIYILLMWILEREYATEPERKNIGIRKWLTYITLFIAGLTLAGDLVTVLYYFIDGQELTASFLLKVLVVFVIALAVFLYYISDIRGKLTSMSKKVWMIVAFVIVLGSIIWGFSVLGSPRTQQLLKYDEQKVNDLQNMDYLVTNYYSLHASLPSSINDLGCVQSSNSGMCSDKQTNRMYEYILIGQSAKAYQLCAEFNKASQKNQYAVPLYYDTTATDWSHPAGRYCFDKTIPANQYIQPKAIPAMPVKQ